MADTLADSQAEMEAETLGGTVIDAPALVDTLPGLQVKMEAETLGDTLSDAQAMVDLLANLRKHWSTRCLTRKQR